MSDPPMAEPLFTIERFAGREGETFQVSAPEVAQPIELSLIRVATWGGPEAAAGGRCFTLLFHGPLQPVLPQHIYRFEHPDLGAFEIFIVPLGPDGTDMQYEAVFS